jgi:hypothetical protein
VTHSVRRGELAVREKPRIHDADLDPAVRSACPFAVTLNVRRHRLISNDYIKTLYCHGQVLRFDAEPFMLAVATYLGLSRLRTCRGYQDNSSGLSACLHWFSGFPY